MKRACASRCIFVDTEALMASAFPRSNTGKLYDPVFLFMLSAVLLALMGSFLIRAAVTGFGTTSQNVPAVVEPTAPR
jgi:hypothetical protein